MKIEVVDSLMGNGKSYSTLRYIENLAITDKSERWIYCTEYLDEIGKRTVENTAASHLWRTPIETGDASKTDSLIEILNEPNTQLIAVTHALLLSASRNTYVNSLLKAKGYKLFLDETLDLMSPYNGIKFGDFLLHMNDKRITVDLEKYGLVKWIDDTVDEVVENSQSSFDKLRKDSANDVIYASIRSGSVGDSVVLMRIEDSIIFTQFSRVIIATYQFDLTLLAAYLKIKGIEWCECNDIVCHKSTTKASISDNIVMVGKHDKKFKKVALSSNWYDNCKRDADDYKLINNTIRNIGDITGCKNKPSKLGYTVPKDSLSSQRTAKGVHPVGYPHSKCLVDIDGKETDVIDKENNCYIPTNARASNDYAMKDVMIHVYNRYPNLQVTKFLDTYKVEYSSERFALNELLQWVWRSAIRNDKQINLAILSERMRDLFLTWLKT